MLNFCMLQASITIRSVEDNRSKEFLLISTISLSTKTDLMTVNLIQKTENPFFVKKYPKQLMRLSRNPKVLNQLLLFARKDRLSAHPPVFSTKMKTSKFVFETKELRLYFTTNQGLTTDNPVHATLTRNNQEKNKQPKKIAEKEKLAEQFTKEQTIESTSNQPCRPTTIKILKPHRLEALLPRQRRIWASHRHQYRLLLTSLHLLERPNPSTKWSCRNRHPLR